MSKKKKKKGKLLLSESLIVSWEVQTNEFALYIYS